MYLETSRILPRTPRAGKKRYASCGLGRCLRRTLYEGTKVDGHALGRGVRYYDMPVIRGVLRDAARSDYRISSIVLGIAKGVPFQIKMKNPKEEEAAPLTASRN
jgi:uncharacterized protein DUF1585